MKKLFLFLFLALLAPFSFAQEVPKVAGPFSPWPPPHNPYLPSPYPSNASVSASPSGASISASGPVQVATKAGTKVPVPTTVTAQISKARVAAAAARCVAGPVGAVVCAATAASALAEAKEAGLGYGPCPPGSESAYAFICKQKPQTVPAKVAWPSWPAGSTLHNSAVASLTNYCKYTFGAGSQGGGNGPNGQGVISGSPPLFSNLMCLNPVSQSWNIVPSIQGTYYCVDGHLNGSMCELLATDPEPATEEEIEQTLQQRMDEDYEAARRLVDAMRQDQEAANRSGSPMPDGMNPIDANTPVSVNSPPVTLPKKTESIIQQPRPDGSTDTIKKESQTTITPITTGSTAGTAKTIYQSTTVITTSVTNNVTNVTNVTTETITEDAEPDDSNFVDPSMPPIPDLYQQKYPNGIQGVWDANKPDIESTQFWQGIRQMFPSFGAGSCPSWSMTFNILPVANYGSIPFDVPCWIFQAIGLILLTTAAFTARKIIF